MLNKFSPFFREVPAYTRFVSDIGTPEIISLNSPFGNNKTSIVEMVWKHGSNMAEIDHLILIEENASVFTKIIPKNNKNQANQITTTLRGLPPDSTLNITVSLPYALQQLFFFC